MYKETHSWIHTVSSKIRTAPSYLGKGCMGPRQFVRLIKSDSGLTGIEYGIIAGVIGAVVFATASAIATSTGQVYTGFDDQYKNSFVRAGDSVLGTGSSDLTNLTMTNVVGSNTAWGFADEVFGFSQTGNTTSGIEIGKAATYMPAGMVAGRGLVIELDGNANSDDVLTRNFSGLTEFGTLTVTIDSMLRPHTHADINEDGIEVFWNGEHVTTIRATSKGTWASDSFTVTGGSGDGSGTLELRSADNASSTGDNGVGMLIAGIQAVAG